MPSVGILLGVAAAALLGSLSAAEPPNFRDHVLPVFKKHCNNCHNPDKKKADLDLTSVAGIEKGSSGGEVVRVGTPDSSPLFLAMIHDDDYDPMPPKKPKLDEKTLAIVRDWITGGMVPHAGGESGLRDVSYDVTAGSAKRPDKVAIPSKLPKATRKPAPVLSVATSPWIDVFAVSGNREIRMYAKQDSQIKLVGALPFALGTIHQLRFSPNGSILAAAGGKGAHSGSVNLYDVASGKLQATIGDEQDVVLSRRHQLRPPLWSRSADQAAWSRFIAPIDGTLKASHRETHRLGHGSSASAPTASSSPPATGMARCMFGSRRTAESSTLSTNTKRALRISPGVRMAAC